MERFPQQVSACIGWLLISYIPWFVQASKTDISCDHLRSNTNTATFFLLVPPLVGLFQGHVSSFFHIFFHRKPRFFSSQSGAFPSARCNPGPAEQGPPMGCISGVRGLPWGVVGASEIKPRQVVSSREKWRVHQQIRQEQCGFAMICG